MAGDVLHPGFVMARTLECVARLIVFRVAGSAKNINSRLWGAEVACKDCGMLADLLPAADVHSIHEVCLSLALVVVFMDSTTL